MKSFVKVMQELHFEIHFVSI